jgi:hypothetical protein
VAAVPDGELTVTGVVTEVLPHCFGFIVIGFMLVAVEYGWFSRA